ncbi:AfsR/SARP family transcriptional regulator [Sphaerisporangium perillae]|uniref:AfsR/SARP family transcriptional regulator n=1 Tax=Sphaerisporangium perillae TaxID=2935860 RepID=UPI00200CB925|nr:BTAD domain-containing putative transcriptional regulator [Sphaerisporangium perillae]
MEFRIMGPLQVQDGARDRTPTAPKHRDLLAVFVLNARRPMTVARLRGLLWPREDGERSDSLVRGYIGQLRQLIGKDVITTTSGTYTLAIEEDGLDVHRFRRLVERGLRAAREGQDDQARSHLREALDLWRGPVLEDVDPDGHRWVEIAALREELEELRLLAVERSIDLDLKAGHHRELVPDLRQLTRWHPLWQRFHGQYMLALYRGGRRVEALEAYTRLREALDEGHAIEPDPELQLLYHRMLHDDVSLHISAGPPVLLPYDVAHFTGREDLLEQLDRLTADPAAPGTVVIHGQAGAGKSALAVHAAWRRRDRFPDGVFYADLRGDHGRAVDPGAVLSDFLRWLGCPAQAMPATLEHRVRLFRAYTADRRLLLLLDNAADEGQVRPLLTSCPTFVTSRSALGGLTDAVRLPVDVLGDDDALEVLVRLIGPERATAERTAMVRLGRICGGLPIALRIAGARLAARPAWTVDHLVGLLDDEHLRLDLLHSGDQTVRSVYSIGYEGLPDKARRMLRMLGAISAPDFADWVAALFGDEAETLVDAGLLETHRIDVAGQVRYRMHDLTRLYAREQLIAQSGENAVRETLTALLSVVMTRVQASRFPLLSGNPTNHSLPATSLQALPDTPLQPLPATPLQPPPDISLHTSPATPLQPPQDTPFQTPPGSPLPGRPDHSLPARPGRRSQTFATTDIRESVTWLLAERDFLTGLVEDLHKAGLWDGARRLAHLLVPFLERHRYLDAWRHTGELALDAARRAGDSRAEALALRDLGDLHRAERHWDLAHERLRLALSMFLRAGVAKDIAHTRRRLGQVLLEQGRPADAERNLTACLATFDNHPTGSDTKPANAGGSAAAHPAGTAADPRGPAATHHTGTAADSSEATEAHRTGRAADAEGPAVAHRTGMATDSRGAAEAHRALGIVLHRTGRLEDAAAHLSRAVSLLSDLRDRHGQADALLDLASVRLSQRLVPEARPLGQEARSIAVRLGDRLLGATALVTLAEVNLAEGALNRAQELAGEALEIFESVADDHGRSRALDILHRASNPHP